MGSPRHTGGRSPFKPRPPFRGRVPGGGGSVGVVAHTFATFDELGDNYGFRKVRERLGVTAFGVNVLAYPPGAVGVHHYHDEQDELYFVHSGTARFDVDGRSTTVGIDAQVRAARCHQCRPR